MTDPKNQDWYENPRWIRAPKHVISAAATVLDESGRILLVKSPFRGWEIPGGQVELGEPLSLAAAREVQEESGKSLASAAFSKPSREVSAIYFF